MDRPIPPKGGQYDSKKELHGDFKSAGGEWRPKGDPEQGKAIPYGV